MPRRSLPSRATLTLATLGAALATAREAGAQRLDRDGVPREQLTVVSRRAARGDWAHQQADRAVWLVRQEDIARAQPRTLADALRDVPGLFLVPTAPGGMDDVVIRGLGGGRAMVLLDGVPLNGAGWLSNTHPDGAPGAAGALTALAAIDPWMLGRVEVQPGPAGVVWGPGAASGVLSLESAPMPEAGTPMRVRTAFRLRVPDLGVAGAHDVAVRAGPFALRAGLVFRGMGLDRAGGGAWLPRTDSAGVSGRVQVWYARRGWELRASYYGGTALGLAQTDPAALAMGGFQESDQTAHLVRISQRIRLGGRWVDQAEVVLFARVLGESRSRVGCAGGATADANARAACLALAPGAVAAQDRITTGSNLFGGYATVHFGRPRDRVRVAAGTDVMVESLDSQRRASPGGVPMGDPVPVGLFAPRAGRTTLGTFVHGEVDVWGSPADQGSSPRLVVTGGARLAYVGTHALDALAVTAPPAASTTEFSDAIVAPLGSLGVRLLPTPGWTAFAGWSQGLTPADPLQSVTHGDASGSAFVLPAAAGTLRAERTNAFELGARARTGPVTAQLALFATLVSDRATRTTFGPDAWAGLGVLPGQVPAGLAVVQWSTASQGNAARYLGGELALSVSPWPHWTFWGHASLVWGEADVAGTTMTEPASRVPPPAASMGVRYERHAFYVELFARGALGQARLSSADRADPRICPGGPAGCEGTAPWATLNARAAFRLGDSLTLDAAVFNATDTRYRYYGAAVDQPGVDAVVTLTGEI